MQDFKRLGARECAERLLSLERPAVVMHIRPDGDTVGSGAALMHILTSIGKSPVYLCAHKIPDRLAFITEGLTKAPDAENYFDYDAVAIDVASPAQLGELDGRITPKLMIDHHEVGSPFADNYVIGGASSAGEVLFTVAEELIKMGALEMNLKIASAIYTAMCSDTGGFVFSNTSPTTLRRAADLMESGVDNAHINHKLFHSKSEEQIRAEGFTASKIKTALGGRIAYAVISKQDRESLSLEPQHFETAIDIVRSLLGAEIAFVIKEGDSGEYKASLRSVGANVAEIAKKFSGGGHIRASGCSVSAGSIDEAASLLLCEVERAF